MFASTYDGKSPKFKSEELLDNGAVPKLNQRYKKMGMFLGTKEKLSLRYIVHWK